MILIADSGGTKTDWALLGSDQVLTFWRTESYHPAQFSAEFWERQLDYWRSKAIDFSAIQLFFFGAGCGNPDAVEQVVAFAKQLGFKAVNVRTDAYAAGLSAHGVDQDGWIIISGTGSVLLDWSNGEVVRQIGGNGYLLGDEGSGFFAGKTLLNRYLNGDFSPETMRALQAELGERAEIIRHTYGSEGKLFVSNQSKLLPNNPEMEAIHEQNIAGFLAHFGHHLRAKRGRVTVVGSYGTAKKVVWERLLRDVATEITFLGEPIQGLVAYFRQLLPFNQ